MRWRGSGNAAFNDVNHDPFKIGPNILSRDSDGFKSMLAGPFVPAQVSLNGALEVMGKAINFNRHRRRLAKEVKHERAKWMLLSKSQPFRTQLKHPPEPDFGRAHALAQLAGFGD